LGKKVGESLQVGGTPMTIVGVVSRASLMGGTPTITMTLADAQRILVGGQPLATTVVATGAANLPNSYTAYAQSAAKADLMRPLNNPVEAIDFVKYLLWAVAGLIVASVVHLSVLERSRDIAVFKATGVSTRAIGAGICLQAVIVSVVASLVSIALAQLLAPFFPMTVDISASSMVLLPLLAVVVGILAGLLGVQRTASVAPATAFGGP